MPHSESQNLVDATGAPIKRPPTVQDRVKKVSKTSRRVMVLILSGIAVLATLITNSEKIIDAVWPRNSATSSEAIVVPDVAVKLHNTGKTEIMMPTRGEYWLWPPGGGVQHYAGAYELKQSDSTDLDSQTITIPANSERTFLINGVKSIIDP